MKFFSSIKRLGLLSLAAAGLLVALCASTSHATLLWYDGFTTKPGGDYTVGDALGKYTIPANPGDPLATPPVPATPAINIPGQSGGTGTFFSGVWDQIGTGDTSGVIPTSLSIPGQINPSTGGAQGEPGAYGTGRTARVFTDQWGAFTDPEGTYYMSYLVNYGGLVSPAAAAQSQHRVLEMFNGDDETDGTRQFMVGYSHYAIDGDDLGMYTKGASPEKVKIDTNPSTPAIDTISFDNDQNKTHLIVLKFEMHINDGDDLNGVESDIVSMYLDPVGTTEPALPNAKQTVANFFVDRLDPNAYFIFEYDPVFSTALPVADELRVSVTDANGSGFANVANWTGVPEPTSLGLVLLGSLGLLAAGRKRV